MHALTQCAWAVVGNVSTAITGGGAEQRKLVEEDLRFFDDEMIGSSWVGGSGDDNWDGRGTMTTWTDRQDASAASGFRLSPRDGERTGSGNASASLVMQAVDEGISGLIRSAAHLR